MRTVQEAKQLIDQIISFSKAPEIRVTVRGNRNGNIRYARNTVSTTGETENLSISIISVFGKRSGSVSVNETSPNVLEKAVRASEEIARLAPENPEFMEGLGAQQYLSSPGWAEATAKADPLLRAEAARISIDAAVQKNYTAAGFLEDSAGFVAIGNNKGLFAYNRDTDGDFTITVRTADQLGSGYARQSVTDISELDTATYTARAIAKAAASAQTRELSPGKYTVILEPIAVGDLLPMMISAMDARTADEGRSYFGKKGNGNKIGEKLFDERVTIYSDPFNPQNPSSPFTAEGLPQQKTTWIENGVLKNLAYSRYWASRKNLAPIPPAQGIIMEGSSSTVEDLIAGTARGILISHLWYIRAVSAADLLFTGLTRDGVFYIENGKIQYAVKNFRFNESPANMLINLAALGKTERVGRHILPAMKVRDFNFTSISDAV